MTVTEPAPAKINLALHLRRLRPDGYHDLETLFAFARDGDRVMVADAAQDSFTVTGPFAVTLAEAGGDNLVLRARDAFRAAVGCPPVSITLDKHLPVASGIGGGSADAAATLRALARLCDLRSDEPRLLDLAALLGADVPACLMGETAFATGRGDQLRPLPPLGDQPLLLVNPGVPLSTAAMFAAWDGADAGPVVWERGVLEAVLRAGNSFTPAAIAAAPIIAAVLDLLATAPGAILARLSGSGATCFALFDGSSDRDAAADRARARGWWTLATVAR